MSRLRIMFDLGILPESKWTIPPFLTDNPLVSQQWLISKLKIRETMGELLFVSRKKGGEAGFLF